MPLAMSDPRPLDEAFRRRFGGRSAAVHDCAEAVIDKCDVGTDLRRRPTTVRVLRAITGAFETGGQAVGGLVETGDQVSDSLRVRCRILHASRLDVRRSSPISQA